MSIAPPVSCSVSTACCFLLASRVPRQNSLRHATLLKGCSMRGRAQSQCLHRVQLIFAKTWLCVYMKKRKACSRTSLETRPIQPLIE